MPADGGISFTRRDLRAIRMTIARMVREATAGRWGVELDVPGQHYGGLSNNELLEILKDQGRDFAHATTAMRAHVRATVALLFENRYSVPTQREINDAIDHAVIEWIVKRFDGKVRDEHLRLLTIPYARAKAKAGYGSKSIGVRTGSLVAAVEDRGRVRIIR